MTDEEANLCIQAVRAAYPGPTASWTRDTWHLWRQHFIGMPAERGQTALVHMADTVEFPSLAALTRAFADTAPRRPRNQR
jgi:hypothetical protein